MQGLFFDQIQPIFRSNFRENNLSNLGPAFRSIPGSASLRRGMPLQSGLKISSRLSQF